MAFYYTLQRTSKPKLKSLRISQLFTVSTTTLLHLLNNLNLIQLQSQLTNFLKILAIPSYLNKGKYRSKNSISKLLYLL